MSKLTITVTINITGKEAVKVVRYQQIEAERTHKKLTIDEAIQRLVKEAVARLPEVP